LVDLALDLGAHAVLDAIGLAGQLILVAAIGVEHPVSALEVTAPDRARELHAGSLAGYAIARSTTDRATSIAYAALVHPSTPFHWTDRAAMLAFVADRAFATLVASIDGRIAVAQAPVLVDGDRLLFHLSRRNPLARALPIHATAIVHGPDAYVSP